MRPTTVADYNSNDRALEMAIDIYFNGIGSPPLRCTRENHIIDCSLLDEACVDSSTPLGAPSSNELSFTLLGENGLFNPANTASTLYGKIKTGVPVRAYIRPIVNMNVQEEYMWDSLGLFFVTDWQTDITGVTASVTANDSIYQLINKTASKLPVYSNCTYARLLQEFLNYNDASAIIIGSLGIEMAYAYVDDTNDKFLNEFSLGALAFIYCNHAGIIEVSALERQQEVQYVLTDSDQIISIKADQSILLEYDGVSLTYSAPRLSDEQELVVNNDQVVQAYGRVSYKSNSFSKVPVYGLNRTVIESKLDCAVASIEANSIDIDYDIDNLTGSSGTFSTRIYGYVIESNDYTLEDVGDNLLKVSNKYIQTEEYAQHVKALLNRYTAAKVPKLELEVRGNPKYAIGSKVRVHSIAYNVDFTGILIRQQFVYDGGLRATMTILNSEIIGA